MQLLNILDDLLQTSRDGKTTAIGAAAEEQIEIGDPVLVAGLKIALAHGQFVKIAQHGQIQFIVDYHLVFHLFFFDRYIIIPPSENSNPFY